MGNEIDKFISNDRYFFILRESFTSILIRASEPCNGEQDTDSCDANEILFAAHRSTARRTTDGYPIVAHCF